MTYSINQKGASGGPVCVCAKCGEIFGGVNQLQLSLRIAWNQLINMLVGTHQKKTRPPHQAPTRPPAICVRSEDISAKYTRPQVLPDLGRVWYVAWRVCWSVWFATPSVNFFCINILTIYSYIEMASRNTNRSATLRTEVWGSRGTSRPDGLPTVNTYCDPYDGLWYPVHSH